MSQQNSQITSPIITEEEQQKILENFEEYQKILKNIKKQKEKEEKEKIQIEIKHKKENHISQRLGEINIRQQEMFYPEGIDQQNHREIIQQERFYPEEVDQRKELYPENRRYEKEWKEFREGNLQENNKTRSIERKRNTCSNCNKEGHYFQDCPEIECEICRKKGHIKRFCPERICGICDKKGHLERDCKNQRIINDLGKEFSFRKNFEENGYQQNNTLEFAQKITKGYERKIKGYLFRNKNITNEIIENARIRHFEWLSITDPEQQSKYKYHCEREQCSRPLKNLHYMQILDRIVCRSCEKIFATQIYEEYLEKTRGLVND
nr:5496_t:CDS:2 [Entrophospora candida]